MNAHRTIPGARLPWAVACTLPLLFFGELGVLCALLLDALLCTLAWSEARWLARQAPEVARRMQGRFLLGMLNEVGIELRNTGAARISGVLRDDCPDEFSTQPSELTFTLEAHERKRLQYTARPANRGLFSFGELHLRLDGGLGLGSALVTVAAAEQVRVYPNVSGVGRYELAARMGALHSVGVRNVRRATGRGEIERLREYVPGDSFRELDWKASAKRLRPITRVHGAEHSHTVLIALDAGRLMATRSGELTKLDHAIHAALLLTWAALRGGDRVGVLVFADEVMSFVPPARGRAQYLRVLEALFSVQARPSYVDFRLLAEFVRARVPKRSLLVLFSDLLDEAQALPLLAAAPRLRGKHVPLCVTMNDEIATALADAAPKTRDAVYERAAAADVLAERDAVKLQLARSGVGLVEAPAARLAVETVNRYLEIKLRHVL